jgi:hypothetical protein
VSGPIGVGPVGPVEPVHAYEVQHDDDAELLKARRSMRRKLIGAAAFTLLTVGVSIMSCVGQSFGLRQARALESIDHRLEVLTKTLQGSPPAATAESHAP